MTTVIGVSFKHAGKVYYFDPGEFSPKPGEAVIVETSQGIAYGKTVMGPMAIDEAHTVQPLRSVVRMADAQDEERIAEHSKREEEAFGVCQQFIEKRELEMKLIGVECMFDESKMLFYFAAEGRVDFRELVRDLAGVYRTRIELRQIGVRDEARLLGGLGPCGRPICCRAFLAQFQPVTIRMAKEQNLSLNPTKISGLCGRLMCCLKYEQDDYEAVRKSLPKVGSEILTIDGWAVLDEIYVPAEKVRVKMDRQGTVEMRVYKLSELKLDAQPGEVWENPPMRENEAAEESDPEKWTPRPRVQKEKPEQPAQPEKEAEAAEQPAQPKPRPERAPRRDRPRRPQNAQPAEGEKNDKGEKDGSAANNNPNRRRNAPQQPRQRREERPAKPAPQQKEGAQENAEHPAEKPAGDKPRRQRRGGYHHRRGGSKPHAQGDKPQTPPQNS